MNENCSHSYSLLSVITHSIVTVKLRSITSRVSDWPKPHLKENSIVSDFT